MLMERILKTLVVLTVSAIAALVIVGFMVMVLDMEYLTPIINWIFIGYPVKAVLAVAVVHIIHHIQKRKRKAPPITILRTKG